MDRLSSLPPSSPAPPPPPPPAGDPPERAWHHYDEEFLSGRGGGGGGGSSPRPATPGSPEQGGDAPSSFVMLNLSSGRQEVDSREWGVLERPKPTGTPSAEEVGDGEEEEEEEEPEMILRPPGEEHSLPVGWGRASPGPSCGKAKPETLASSSAVSKGAELSGAGSPAGNMVPVTPTSPADALAEGVLTQVREGRVCVCVCVCVCPRSTM